MPKTEPHNEDEFTPLSPDLKVITSHDGNDILQYLQVPADFIQGLNWSNNPGFLKLQTYFNPRKPSLGGEFGVKGLKPILREMDDEYRFVLVDDKHPYYLYEEWGGFLNWVKSRELDYVDTDLEKIDYITCAIGNLNLEPVFRGDHPADRAEKTTNDGAGE